MTQLRQKMIRAMELRNLSSNTRRAYLRAVTGIARFYKQSPDKMTKEKIGVYLLYLKRDKAISPNNCYSVLTGLRFFYKNVVENEIPVTYSMARNPRKLPEVLTIKDVWKIICSTNNLKHRLILMTTYSAGLRVGETMNLKPEHINSKRRIVAITIPAMEFIRRFLLHSLPTGFVRIRNYGFLANRNRSENLNAIRQLMGISVPLEKEIASLEEMMQKLTGTDITTCPCCSEGKMKFFGEIPKGRGRPTDRLACSAT